jgi:alpha-glucosidase
MRYPRRFIRLAIGLIVGCGQISLAQHVSQIGPSTYEFWPDKESASEPRYSLSFVTQPKRLSPQKMPQIKPVFGFSTDGRYSVEVSISLGTDLYGTGEVAGPLRRNGRVTECWNTDQFNYSEKDPSLYQSHPWVLAVRKDGTAFGVLADTTYRCRIDLRKGIKFEADGPRFPVILIEGQTPQDVVMRLADLTGHMQLPPMWALGYHQCRWSYMSQEEVLRIADEFRNRHIPCDTIWLDIDYMDGFRIFTFNKSTFPAPRELNRRLAEKGFHNVWMIDPGIKIDETYSVYRTGQEKDVFIKTILGRDQEGDVWPGKCVFPDFTSSEVRAWWKQLYQSWIATGISGVWNDMNEPAFFNVDSKTMPEDARHRGGGNLKPGPHAEYHNVYGSLMALATFEGIKTASPDKRPFVLTRAGYIGYQRYAATWTGDNASSWSDLKNAIPMVLNLGLSGQPFVGPDIPGFSGNGPTDKKEANDFFSRWWGVGSLLPFARGHSHKDSVRKEPWSFGPLVEESARRALWRRYVLLPYLYTTFKQSSEMGLPVARPLFFADLKDQALRSEMDGFLLGGDIAVAARVQKETRQPAMPKGWLPLNLDADHPDIPKLHIRPGAIVPLGPQKEFVSQRQEEKLYFAVAPDKHGAAIGQLYEDAGDGYGYRKGDHLLTTYRAQLKGNRMRMWISAAKGSRRRPDRQVQIYVLQKGNVRAVSVPVPDGQEILLIMPMATSRLATATVGPSYRR